MKKQIEYPAEITFKSVFSRVEDLDAAIDAILNSRGIAGSITWAESKNGKYVSYTITAEFESEDHLQAICRNISTLTGFIMML